MAKKIRVASWNIWVFGKRDFKGIAEVVRKNKIDIIGLQEVGVFSDGKKENMSKNVADELGYDYAFYPSKDFRLTKKFIIGNAIVSKFPIVKSKVYPLNPKNILDDGTFMTEPRTIIHSVIRVGDKETINFLTTHLQYSEKFETNPIKKAEIKTVLSLLDSMKNITILTGDFNLTPQSREIKRIEKVLKRIGGNKPTWTIYPFEAYGWTETRLKYRLDNIFVSKGVPHRNFQIIKSDISDHLPIMTDITV